MTAMAPALSDNPVMDEVAEIWRPRKRVRPSAWAESNRWLKEGTTPQPGRWSNDYLPWIRAIIDVWHDEPWKEGVVTMKPAQHGISELFITLLGYLADEEGGPICFACTTADDAKDFSLKRFEPMIENSPRLASIFLRGKGNHETRLIKPYAGGQLNIVGSGSPNKFISQPYRFFFIDEEDQLADFPGIGSARDVAEKRTAEFRTRVRTGLFSWAHPTRPDRGVAKTFTDQSDQREWTIVCPHCGEDMVPRWKHARIDDRDPATATYITPCCGEVLTDAQRWKATKVGRFVSALPAEVARKARFAGFHFSALCHPRIALVELAREYCNCHSESQLQVFFNMRLGLPYTPAQYVITDESIDEKRREMPPRSCPSNTVFITLGVDVQVGAWMFYRVSAWTRNGNELILDIGKAQGWAALDALARTFQARRPDDAQIRIAAAGIDYGYLTKEVYQFCRQDHGGVPFIPMKHTPNVRADDPIRYKKTYDPARPHAGPLTRLELCRDHWMDRQLGRFSPDADPDVGGSVVLPIGTPDEFKSHIKSARRAESLDEFGHPRITWVKEKGDRDDWLQAGVYGEVIAVLKGLDQIHELPPEAPAEAIDEVREGLIQRQERFEGRSGRHTRGRRGRARSDPYG